MNKQEQLVIDILTLSILLGSVDVTIEKINEFIQEIEEDKSNDSKKSL